MRIVPPPLSPGQVAVLRLGRQVAAALAREATDPALVLPMADRLAVAALALAVEIEASHRAGVASRDDETRSALATALADLERRGPVRCA